MTTPSDSPIPDENEDQPSGADTTQEGAPGVELGLSESGGTFEPEEDVEPDS